MYSSDNIFDILVDFEEEEILRREYEDLQSNQSGNKENISLDIEKYREERRQIKKELAQTQDEIAQMLTDAQVQADEIKIRAREEGLEIGERQGYEKGYLDGYEKAQTEVEKTLKKEADDLLKELKDLILSVEQNKKELLDKYKDDLRDIAIAIAEKIIRVSLKSSGDIIKRMIISATEGIMSKEWVKIYISRCDAEMAVNGDTMLINSISYVSDHIKIVVMENEAPGTCILEFPDKVIDASTNTQIENIKEIISSSRI
ncbi:FliH/SctL family protein [Proteocatella sphenisci]|uniref:FliH/SctL family protein n=1 Tax=Proteocatella sphenisci TaxID=181070 RepID=UPI0004AEA086|nr:FliH/SctL family protein [Proteocatella sphenisci]